MGLSRQLTAVGLTINLTEINLVISDNPYTSAINLKPSSRAYAVISVIAEHSVASWKYRTINKQH